MSPQSLLVSVLICMASSCTASDSSRVAGPSGSPVRVLTGQIPSGCVWLLNIGATDGAAEPAPRPVNGTREGATAKLRSLAAAYGADTITIDESETTDTISFEGGRGNELRLVANAYRCSSP